jgi:hypothetical protein
LEAHYLGRFFAANSGKILLEKSLKKAIGKIFTKVFSVNEEN